jgi:hypothetical protein
MVSQEDIIKPLLFLDIFDYPPTAMEIWRFLPVQAELGEVIESLPQLGGVSVKNGFYFLPGREEIVEKRREFNYLSEKKFKIAERAAWLIHFIPTVKMAAVCNNFYYREQSDIDFFIIAEKKRMWLTRLLVTALLHLFRLRRHDQKIADRICLSFYITEDALNLSGIALQPDDPYLYYWLGFLEPVYGQECYNEFWAANDWLKKYFPNILRKETNPSRLVKDGFVSRAKKGTAKLIFGGWLGDFVEKSSRWVQLKKISANTASAARFNDGRVIISDTMLKFHENDRRKEFRNQLKVKNEKLKIK